ncbi:MAG TPA: hypothetical protein VF683_02525, partial [Chthoniobacterales bacterium]
TRGAIVAAVIIFFALLQIWRPYFFLTDDNMSGVLPGFTEFGNLLRQGKFPRHSESLYAGTYDFWRDPGVISFLFPVHTLAALVATTSLRLFVIDGVTLLNLIIGALAMHACVRAYCRRFDRPLPDGIAAFIGVSYVTTVYSLAIGSSWFNFLANQAAMPLIAIGLVVPRRKTGIAIVCGGMLYNLLAGHLSPFFYTVLFLGILALATAALLKSWEAVWRYACGSLFALVIVSPVLIAILSSFAGTTRNSAMAEAIAVQCNLPVPALIGGALAGIDSIAGWNFRPVLGYLAEIPLPLSFSAIAICLLGLLFYARKFSRVEWTIVAILAVVALFVHRPLWLQTLIAHVPLYRSLRWPMRETFVFLFFAHLLLAFGWRYFHRRLAVVLPLASAAIYLVPLFFAASPTLNRFPVDRLLLLDGRAERVWREVGDLLPGAHNCYIVPLLQNAERGWGSRVFISQAPHTLLGGYSYPVLFSMKSATGYTMPGFAQEFRNQRPMLGPGYFTPSRFAASDLEDPQLLFTRLASLNPVTIEYRMGVSVVHATFPAGLASEPVVARVQ